MSERAPNPHKRFLRKTLEQSFALNCAAIDRCFGTKQPHNEVMETITLVFGSFFKRNHKKTRTSFWSYLFFKKVCLFREAKPRCVAPLDHDKRIFARENPPLREYWGFFSVKGRIITEWGANMKRPKSDIRANIVAITR